MVYPALLLFLSHLLPMSVSNTFSLRGKGADLGIRARHASDSSELKEGSISISHLVQGIIAPDHSNTASMEMALLGNM